MPALQQFCSFYLDDLLLGVNVEQVQEVVQTESVTRVPLANAAVAGLINLRGQIVTAVNLRECLQRDAAATGRLPLSLVIRSQGTIVSLLIDRVGDVLDVQETDFTPTPETVDRDVARLLSGAYKLPQSLLLVLDADAVVTLVKGLHSSNR